MKDHEIAQAVSNIHNETCAQDALAMVDEIIGRGDARRLVTALVAIERVSCDTDEDAVSQTMQRLESLTEQSLRIASSLMAYLYPFASELRMHDVWDAIDLWICSCDAEGLTRQLAVIAQSEGDADMRKHFEQLVHSRSHLKGESGRHTP